VQNAPADDAALAIENATASDDRCSVIVTRRARTADLAELAGELGTRSFFKDRLQRQKKQRGRLFVAELDGKIVGTVYLWLEQAEEEPIRTHLPGVPILTHLEVRKSYRNKMIGTALINAVERRLTVLNKHQVALAVRTDNATARRLYERLGYREWEHGTIQCRKYNCPPEELEECNLMTKTVATAGC
jgi:ribosomal protein S18 acetylase RimI-like enzyme